MASFALRDLCTITDYGSPNKPAGVFKALRAQFVDKVATRLSGEIEAVLDTWELLGDGEMQGRFEALHEALAPYTDALPPAALGGIDLRETARGIALATAVELWIHLTRGLTANQLLSAWGLPPLEPGTPLDLTTEAPKRRRRASKDAGPGLNSDILKLARAHSATKNIRFCELLDTSPGTLENWTSGRYPWNPTPDQIALLRKELEDHSKGLILALEFLELADSELVT